MRAALVIVGLSVAIFTAIQELGLRLVSITTSIEVIVIDRAERPAGN